jgi:SAM-dependent methyltransferase
MTMNGSTVRYYDENAERYFHETVDVDLSSIQARFLARLPKNADILDAGCGSGRDALAFSRLGHRVTAFDASPAIAALASRHLGQPVQVMRFAEVGFEEAFDGVWACAALLHVPSPFLPDALTRLTHALRVGGIFYMSFKEGSGERLKGGRRFTDLQPEGLRHLLAVLPGLGEPEIWRTADARPGRGEEYWVNALVGREA